jgi:hypothetical protein
MAYDKRLSVHDRVRALDWLDYLARQLNKAAVYLAEQGFETEADLLDQAAKDTMAAVGMLSRPLRGRPPAELWQQPQQQPAADGQRYQSS